MPPKKSKSQPTVSISESVGTVKIDSFILQIRNLCRARGLQIWNKQSLSDQIYKDILFLYHVPRLQRSGYLNLNVERIGDGKISEPSFKAIMSLKEPALIGTAFKRLWKELQVSSVSKLFDSREFAMFPIEKKDGTKYLSLLMDILDYASKVELAPYDSDSGHTYFNKDLAKGLAKTFGQFYTPGAVVKSIIKELALSSNDTVLDPSCGSCSFLQEAGDTLVKKEGLTAETAFKNLYGVEVEPNIYVDGLLNTFTRFGMLPDMEHNIREADAFKILLSEDTQYDKIPANPPFGADAKSFQEFYFKTIMEPKGKKLVNKTIVNPELKFQIPFPHTGESAILFFQIIIQKLKLGGKAGVVMSSTILNDGNKDMMKWFLEQCSLEKVIINPAGTFKDKGTGIETFSFVFTKGKPTTTVSIVMLGAEETVVRSLTLAEIEAAGWKLQLKEEEKKEAYTGEYQRKQLSQIASLKQGFPFKSADYKDSGLAVLKHNNLQSGLVELSKNQDYIDSPGETNEYVLVPGDIVVSMDFDCGKVGKIYTDGWVLNQRMCLVRSSPSEILQSYLYWDLFMGGFHDDMTKVNTGTTIKHISGKNIAEAAIVVPPLPIQEQIVASLDRIFTNPQDTKDCLAFTSNAMDLMLKDPTGKLLEDVLGGLRLKRAHLANADSVKAQMAALVKSVSARGYQRKKLKDLLDFPKTIKRFNSGDRDSNGTIPFFNGKWSCPDGTHTDHSFELNCPYLVMIKDGGGNHDSDSVGMGKFFKVNGKCAITSHNMILTMKPENGTKYDYLYHYLTYNARQIRDMATYSINLGAISKESIMNYEIPVPPLAEQEKVLTILNEMEAERKVLEQMAAKAEERAKFVLEGYLTPAAPQEEEFTYNENGEIVFDDDA